MDENTLIKVLPENLRTRGFQYKIGLNVAPEADMYDQGVLHCAPVKYLGNWISLGKLVFMSEIPEGEQIWETHCGFASKRLIVYKPTPLGDFLLKYHHLMEFKVQIFAWGCSHDKRLVDSMFEAGFQLSELVQDFRSLFDGRADVLKFLIDKHYPNIVNNSDVVHRAVLNFDERILKLLFDNDVDLDLFFPKLLEINLYAQDTLIEILGFLYTNYNIPRIYSNMVVRHATSKNHQKVLTFMDSLKN